MSKTLKGGLLKLPERIQVIFIVVILDTSIRPAILGQLCKKETKNTNLFKSCDC